MLTQILITASVSKDNKRLRDVVTMQSRSGYRGSSCLWQTKENLCRDILTNKITITHRHTHTDADKQAQMLYERSLHIYEDISHGYMQACTCVYHSTCTNITWRHNRCTHPGLLLNEGPSGVCVCVLWWELLSCWKMLFTVFTGVSLNCHPQGSGIRVTKLRRPIFYLSLKG